MNLLISSRSFERIRLLDQLVISLEDEELPKTNDELEYWQKSQGNKEMKWNNKNGERSTVDFEVCKESLHGLI